jgi:hypothetical protein
MASYRAPQASESEEKKTKTKTKAKIGSLMSSELDAWVEKQAQALGPCPKCKSKDNVVPVAMGKPAPELMAAADAGKVHLGGCCIGPDSPLGYCNACKEGFK